MAFQALRAQVLEHVCHPAGTWYGRALPKALDLLSYLPAVSAGAAAAGDHVHQGHWTDGIWEKVIFGNS